MELEYGDGEGVRVGASKLFYACAALHLLPVLNSGCCSRKLKPFPLGCSAPLG